MAGELGGSAAGANMLQEILRQKFAQALAFEQQKRMAAAQQQQAAFQDESLGLQRRAAERADESARVLNDQRNAAMTRQQSEDATAANHGKLRGLIQASQNMAGTDDPTGAVGTRNALRVALAHSGAKDTDIPQEPVAKPAKLHAVTTTGPNGQPLHKLVSEAEMQQGVQGYRAPKEQAGAGAKFWVVRNGQMLRITDAEYRPGDQPANTREQGRPVTSSDAGRIADLDTSMDDLNVLTRDLGKTGTASKVGAMMPNAVTDLTGIGADAKSRQAVIDRVKQVIGKALEGGVLRKEDEIKYERILPTIGDPPDVAERKLQGLFEAIDKRRQTQIESLSDAGYDVTKFAARPKRQRGDAPPNDDAAKRAADLIKKYGGG
jgi:hypothetical protein